MLPRIFCRFRTPKNVLMTVSFMCNFRGLPDGLAHATGVHERNTVPYARFALKKRHGFCAKAREKNMQRHRLGTL